ncbi:porin [Castellaniella defragrans]|uniref:porin n=1 Tax=Castellaniella defragrans TaxID=75697 RepID=UPI0005BAFBAE|nr:porin [Castellaniella defragrans]
MKKTLLAAALLAGFATAGVAQAETSVTLYGILDTGYGYQNYKYDHAGADITSKSSGLRDGTFNGNRFGLKGSEDLGDGLRAIFQLEQGFNLGDGTAANSTRAFHRQAFVGLSSDNWGTFTMGRQYSAGVDTFLVPNGVNLGDADKIFGSTGLGEGTRVDNSFKYVTPDLSGFKFIALYGTDNDGGTTVGRRTDGSSFANRGTRVSVGALYANGPIGVGASYDRQSQTSSVGGVERSAATSWQINGSYDFEVVKLGLAYGQDRHGKMGWNGAPGAIVGGNVVAPGVGFPNTAALFDDFKSNNYHVGLSAPLAGGTLYAGWNYSTSNLDNGDKLGDDAGSISTYQLNYVYPLSKRTSLYTYASYAKNIGYVKDLKGTEAGVGLNHKF